MRFSLQTLVCCALLAGCGLLLWANRQPWVVVRKIPEPAFQAHFTSDGQSILIVHTRNVTVYDATTGLLKNRWSRPDDDWQTYGHAVFSPDGERMVTAFYENFASIWNTQTASPIARLTGHSDIILSVAYSPDGKSVATSSRDGTIRIWNALDGAQMKNVDMTTGSPVNCLQFSPDGKFLAAVRDEDTFIHVFDATSGLERFKIETEERWLRHVSFNVSGTKIAVAGAMNHACVYQVENPRVIQQFNNPKDWLHSVEFSPDEKLILTADQDRTAAIWNLWTGEKLVELVQTEFSANGGYPGVRSAEFSKNGRFICTTHSDGTCIWQCRRPEYWWGIFWLWEFWMSALCSGLIFVSLRRDTLLQHKA